MPKQLLEEFFWSRVNKDGPAVRPELGTCWIWTGSFSNGYGTLCFDQKKQGAHRVSHEINIGPIPPGMIVCHRCDNPPCVNPAHLFAGTYRDNVLDMLAKGRGKFIANEEHMWAVLTDEQVVETRRRYALGNISQRVLAEEFNVVQGTISRIVHGMRRGSTTDPGRRNAPKLRAETVDEIRRRFANGERRTEIARSMNIRVATVSGVIAARAYAKVAA